MKIRTAILGCGRSGGSMHANAIQENHEYEIVATCDINPEAAGTLAERFSCKPYTDYMEMLKIEKPDLVSVVTRNDQHCVMTCDCLEHGANVLVTKPWALDSTEAKQMTAAEKKYEKVIFPWLPARWGCGLARLRELLDDGTIGKVFMIRHAVCGFSTRDDWQTRKEYGGGYLLNWGPHIVDPPMILAGGKPSSVYAQMRQVLDPGDVEDMFSATIVAENGIIIQAERAVALKSLPTWVVQGDRGTIVVNDNKLTIRTCNPNKPSDPTDVAATNNANKESVAEETLEGQVYGDAKQIYSEVAESLATGKTFAVTSSDAADLTILLDAIRAAADENRVVAINN